MAWLVVFSVLAGVLLWAVLRYANRQAEKGRRAQQIANTKYEHPRCRCYVVPHFRFEGKTLHDYEQLFFSHVVIPTGIAEDILLQRIVVDPEKLGGKPIIRGHRLAVEDVLGMLAAGDTIETLLDNYDWLEIDDIRACLLYAYNTVADANP